MKEAERLWRLPDTSLATQHRYFSRGGKANFSSGPRLLVRSSSQLSTAPTFLCSPCPAATLAKADDAGWRNVGSFRSANGSPRPCASYSAGRVARDHERSLHQVCMALPAMRAQIHWIQFSCTGTLSILKCLQLLRAPLLFGASDSEPF